MQVVINLILLISLLPKSYCFLGIGSKQSVAVTGRLICNGWPAVGVKVKLYEKEVLLDRKMAEGRTDAFGCFYLWGSMREITTIDPKVNIYHTCNHAGVRSLFEG
ncbi:unnamed protein product [Strongylus vulgaris]|uniref:Transthyretin-like family protein n=1 Tax=Strongylus vulgaris TaxID=40348 RepID=A0A3P7JJY5_STRVU|nr:unnamed protein product [Strongylus vulgaris]